ncbi:MAG: hypothetical protein GXO08_01765 [Aquificae bacterium]|nr:hypothetical protein [Aquificota bacterium]
MEKLVEDVKLLLKELELPHLVKYVEDITQSVDKVHIAFVGEYNAGKSSLINALVGKKVVAERDLPTTNRIVLVTHCPVEKREKLDPHTELVCINDPKLEHVILVDTPGLSSAVKEHEETLLTYLHKADLIVIVAPSNQPYTKEIEELLKLLAKKHTTQLAYVINVFEDPSVYEEDPDKIRRLKEFVREKLRSVLSAEDVDRTPIFAFSLRLVRAGKEGPLTAEWEEFRRFIFEEVAERAKKIKFASVKEKLLKLLSGSEVLEKRARLERLGEEKRRWETLKERVSQYAGRVEKERAEQIDRFLDRLFSELRKEVEEVLAKYGSLQLAGDPRRFVDELLETVEVRILRSGTLSEVEALLDYRPAVVRLKKLYPELVVEPTIPARLGELREALEADLKRLPETVGRPGRYAKVFLVFGLLALVGAAALAVAGLTAYAAAVGALGALAVFGSLYRLLTLKSAVRKKLLSRLERLRGHYSKLYKGYFNEQFRQKIDKVLEFVELNLTRVSEGFERLYERLKRVEELKERVVKEL